ncbi:B2 protein-like [Dioscorea cayenensis subsp. rotundata]|uniref:B2 protein-like n=1 Tax=Dioscorea cayennensis subsp. rotundata TaxID=55577 RepID=A0AB40CZE9_DIOCR|nr:B2 protein-like [Dioscorea cayenensis subsp. rotundata]
MDADREFLNFSDQLRLHTTALSNLSLGDTIWSESYLTTKTTPINNDLAAGTSWKSGFGPVQKLAFADNKANRFNNDQGSIFPEKSFNYFNNSVPTGKNAFKNLNGGGKQQSVNNNAAIHGVGSGKKGGNSGKGKKNSGNDGNGGAGVDKRFKTLPPSESLPRNEAIGGYIFVCNNDTMQENLHRQLFGLPQRYRDSVRAITPGLPIFLYNYSTHQLHGIFEAASFGGTNIDPAAWEDKKKPGESRFPAQVRVMNRKNCEPLEEDSFRPILHHYDGPKFRLELSVPEALDVLDKFAEHNA